MQALVSKSLRKIVRDIRNIKSNSSWTGPYPNASRSCGGGESFAV
jgi:hypothetical protein